MMEIHHFFRRSSLYFYGQLRCDSKLSWPSLSLLRSESGGGGGDAAALDKVGGRKLSRQICVEVLDFLESRLETFYEKRFWNSVKAELTEPSRTYACFLNEFSPDVVTERGRIRGLDGVAPLELSALSTNIRAPSYFTLPSGKKFPRMRHSDGFFKPHFAIGAASILPVHLLVSFLPQNPPPFSDEMSVVKENQRPNTGARVRFSNGDSSVPQQTATSSHHHDDDSLSILDLCAAPGGKTLLLLNYLHLSFADKSVNSARRIRIYANEAKRNRYDRMVKMFQSHLPGMDLCIGRTLFSVGPNIELSVSNEEGENFMAKELVAENSKFAECVSMKSDINSIGFEPSLLIPRSSSSQPACSLSSSSSKSPRISFSSKESASTHSFNDSNSSRGPTLFDAVLVDVPCSADRSWIFNHPDNPSLTRRLHDFDHLPGLHLRLLDRALHLLKPGGVAVYCTCTMDVMQNEEVVKKSLAVDETRFRIIPLDAIAEKSKDIFSFCDKKHFIWPMNNYGMTIVPSVGKSWGPMYIVVIEKLLFGPGL